MRFGVDLSNEKAAVSVALNLVEGSARKNRKEYLQFLYVAISSLTELSYYVRFTNKLGYLEARRYAELSGKAQETLRTLQGLISYIEKSDV